MSPRTNSPPPSSYAYDDINEYDYPSGPSTGGHQTLFNNIYSSQHQQNNIMPNGTNLFRNDISGTPSTRINSSKDNKNEKGLFPALLLHPLNVSRKVLSSSAVKCVSLMVLYSFCIATVCFIFFVSYVLTFYDDARRLLHSSRVWARLKNGVRERISMMGDDWEDFFQKYFEDGVDVNRNAHLGATNDTGSKRNPNESGTPTDDRKIPSAKDLEWLKGAMLGFIAVIAGQDATNQFQQSANSFRSGGDTGRR